MTDPFAVDWMELLCREVLRERTGALVAEACAWAVGLFEAKAWLGAVVAGTGLALLLRLLALSKERRGASSEGVLILGASRMAARLIADRLHGTGQRHTQTRQQPSGR